MAAPTPGRKTAALTWRAAAACWLAHRSIDEDVDMGALVTEALHDLKLKRRRNR